MTDLFHLMISIYTCGLWGEFKVLMTSLSIKGNPLLHADFYSHLFTHLFTHKFLYKSSLQSISDVTALLLPTLLYCQCQPNLYQLFLHNDDPRVRLITISTLIVARGDSIMDNTVTTIKIAETQVLDIVD